jgi:hypothetical protein
MTKGKKRFSPSHLRWQAPKIAQKPTKANVLLRFGFSLFSGFLKPKSYICKLSICLGFHRLKAGLKVQTNKL